MRSTIALFHHDKYFYHAFLSLVSDKYKRKYEIIGFTNEEKYKSYLKENNSKNFFAISEYEILKSIEYNNIIKIVTSNFSNLSSKDKLYYLNIYQAGDDIMSDIEKIVLSLNPEIVNNESPNSNVTCFFSTQGGSGVSTIAYMTAVGLSNLGKTLYLNLEQLGDTDKLYINQNAGNLYDLIVSASSKTDCTQSIISLSSKNAHGVYVMPKFQSMGELYTLNIDNYSYLIDSITNCGYFDYIIIDTIHGINKINEMIFAKCNNLFAVYTSDALGVAKMNRLANDPFVKRFEFFDQVKFILNKSDKKIDDDIYVSVFPLSQSTYSGTDIATVLKNNQSIYNSIEKIKGIIVG